MKKKKERIEEETIQWEVLQLQQKRDIICEYEKKNNGKAKKAIDGEDELVLCSIIANDEKLVQEKKKVHFANDENLKLHMQTYCLYARGKDDMYICKNILGLTIWVHCVRSPMMM